MAFNPAPSAWLPCTSNSTSHTFTITTADGSGGVPGLTDAFCNPTTGDIRKVIYALLKYLTGVYLGLASADRPVRLIIDSRGQESGSVYSRTYSYTFNLDSSVATVVNE